MRKFILALQAIGCLMLAGLIITPFSQIIMRSLFDVPMAGAEEVARYMLICLTFLAAALVSLEGGQIKMEEFQSIIPERPRWWLQLAIELCSIVLFGYLSYAAIGTIFRNISSRTATLEMPFAIFMGPLAIGAVLLTFASAVMFWQTFSRGKPDAKQTTLT
ncbi:DctM TRAP-type C4-dicarboxylate transport system, small permease component [Rhabdaerophilaceae bacterium]